MTNYETALKAEMKRVVRSTYRPALTYRRLRRGRTFGEEFETIYTHPELPNICFKRRSDAARAVLDAAGA